MGSPDIDNLLNILTKMDESKISEGVEILNNFLNENDKKKIFDALNRIKNKNN